MKLDPFKYEKEARLRGCKCVVGVDEAGRGPLAGPVVAAAVVLPDEWDLQELKDSKAMTAAARERTYERILREAVSVGVGVVSPAEIDEINILKATHKAMRAALDIISVAFDYILVDGLPVPGLPCESCAIIGGDAKSASIMAASVVAKVARDRMMEDMDRMYPGYGFASHKGYYTPEHIAAIRSLGPCECHRKSFRPVSEMLAQCVLPGLD